MADDDGARTMHEGEFGLVIRLDGAIEMIVAAGHETRPLIDLHAAILGAALRCVNDADFMFDQLHWLEDRPEKGASNAKAH